MHLNRRQFASEGLAVTAVLALAAALGCVGKSEPTPADDASAEQNARPSIVCTTTMIGDIAREVAGDLAEVHVLFGPTVDPHLFRATRDDVAQLMRADLVMCNGFGLEGYLEPHFKRVGDTGIPLLHVAETILKEGEAMTDAGVVDPHVWMDPSLWSRTAPAMATALAEALGAEGAPLKALNERASAIEQRLLQLDARTKTAIASIPEPARILVTAHDAFRYFGRRYTVRVEGVQGLSTASEGGLQAIESLVDLIVESTVPAVFVESTVSERNIKALVEGAGARGHNVALGGTLHSDAPGAAGTYERMIEHNVNTITTALGGTPLEPAHASADKGDL